MGTILCSSFFFPHFPPKQIVLICREFEWKLGENERIIDDMRGNWGSIEKHKEWREWRGRSNMKQGEPQCPLCGLLWPKETARMCNTQPLLAAPRSQESRGTAYVQEQNGWDRRGHRIRLELASTSPPRMLFRAATRGTVNQIIYLLSQGASLYVNSLSTLTHD